MTIPTVAVTVKLAQLTGVAPLAGVTVTATLDKDDRYQGFVVVSSVSGVVDVNGEVVLQCFPNNPTTGLGTTGSVYTFSCKAVSFRCTAQVPNSACNLHDIADLLPLPSLNQIDVFLATKDASGGFPGLTLFKLNLKNTLGTITSWFTTAATVARTWTMPDKDGTVAMTSDITGTNSGSNTGDETGARIATLHHAASVKSALVDADEVTGGDSAAGFGLIRTTWASVKAYLKTYFDTLYMGALPTIIQMGGTTSAFPALLRAGSGAVLVTADNSLYASFQAQNIQAHGTLDSSGDATLAQGAWYANSATGNQSYYGLAYIGWVSGLANPGVANQAVTRLYRDADHVLAMRNGVNAQEQRWYENYTDPSNYSRGYHRFNGATPTFTIGTEAAGTGVARDLVLRPASGITKVPSSLQVGTESPYGALYVFSNTAYTAGGTMSLQFVTPDANFGGMSAYGQGHAATMGGVAIAGGLVVGSNNGPLFFGANTRDIHFVPGTTLVLTIGNNGLVKFGGSTNAFPALKRNGAGIDVRLADDGGYGALTASYLASNPVAVAALPAAAAGNKGWRGFVIDATATLTAGIGAVVAGGGANGVPVISDGGAWRIG